MPPGRGAPDATHPDAGDGRSTDSRPAWRRGSAGGVTGCPVGGRRQVAVNRCAAAALPCGGRRGFDGLFRQFRPVIPTVPRVPWRILPRCYEAGQPLSRRRQGSMAARRRPQSPGWGA